MAKAKNKRGTPIANVGPYTIFQKNTNETDSATKKMRTVKTTISIYQGKTMLKDGFKNKAEAIAGAEKILVSKTIGHN